MSMGRGWIGLHGLLLLALLAAPAWAVDSAFTYQGQLKQEGVPADGTCDLRFELFDAAVDGGLIGAPQTYTDVVIANGLFTLQLNFGAQAFDGDDRWLQIATRCPAGGGAFATLTPRQPLTATPYALFAASIADEAVTSAKLADSAVGNGQLAAGAVTGDKVADESLDESTVGFNFAGSTSKGGPATELVCTACIGVNELSPAGSVAGQVPVSNGAAVIWRAPFELPFSALNVNVPLGIDAFAITLSNTSAGSAAHFVTPGSQTIASPTLLAEYGGFGGVAIEGRATNLNSGGVLGTAPGSLRAGVQGTATGTSGIGVRGQANSGSGAKAVHGISDDGFAGYFDGRLLVDADPGDNPLVVQTNAANVARIDATGKGFFNGGTQVGGADVAEFVPTSDRPGPGDVVEIDPDSPGHFRRAATANSTAVAGVISTEPGVSLNAAQGATQAASGPQLALVGRVPVKATAENGAIRPGDLLVASALPGHAMRGPANPAPGTVIGKALSPLAAGVGVTDMLVMLR